MTDNERMIDESNHWFQRNKDAIEKRKESNDAKFIGDFLKKWIDVYPRKIHRLLEVGCSYGFNLNYYYNLLGIECYGIEPSNEAVEFGRSKYGGVITLEQGMSNNLPYDNNFFDIVILGFCMYQVPRMFLHETIFETDRVLNSGRFLAITDFDTPVYYKRVNIHNKYMPVYKMDVAEPYRAVGYTLVEKKSSSSDTFVFNPNVQERISTQILYKESFDDLYVLNE